jgi:hypothetical protein
MFMAWRCCRSRHIVEALVLAEGLFITGCAILARLLAVAFQPLFVSNHVGYLGPALQVELNVLSAATRIT